MFLFLAMPLFAADECASVEQEISIEKGWNALYINVIPTLSADELFEAWPADSISVYRTISVNDLGTLKEHKTLPESRFFTWHRDMPEASTLKHLPGDCTLVFKATADYTTKVTGTPIARQMTWEGGENATNFFGITTKGSAVTTNSYFKGLSTPSKLILSQMSGEGSEPTFTEIRSSKSLSNNEALLVQNVLPSVWSGAFSLTPRYGLDFGEGATVSAFTITNQSGGEQTVHFQLNGPSGQGAPSFGLYWREITPGQASVWTPFTPNHSYKKTLAENESWTVLVGLDRQQFASNATGDLRVGILTVSSSAIGNHYEQIPIFAKSYTLQSDTSLGKWPNGLWLLEAQMDTVTRIVSSDGAVEHNTKTASTMPIRLLLYVDGNQQMTLLQRVTLAVLGNQGTKQSQILYGPHAIAPNDATDKIRISTPLMPVDVPSVPLQGTFLAHATATFTVGEDSPSNPWRHPYHPEHDGLDWDFKGKAPSGDTLDNYKAPIKPERWSVGNTLELLWDAPSATWAPEESYTGHLTWILTGLRHEAPIVVRGPFTLRRILVDPTYQEK
jgi:hypothetical protein